MAELLIAAAAAANSVLWGASAMLGWRRQNAERRRSSQLELLPVYAALEAARRTGLLERLQIQIAGLHGKLLALRGGEWRYTDTERYAASAAGFGWAAWTCGTWLAVLSHEPAMLGLSAFIGALIPYAKLSEPAKQLERRRQDMVLALPDLLGKLMLLVGAGETVQRAIVRCMDGRLLEGKQPANGAARQKKQPAQHPLHAEWAKLTLSLENGESFPVAVEAFSKRCAVQEVSMFATVVLLHYRKGGDQFALALRELSFSLWEKRKATVRIRGEQSSSKLVFPLAGIFFLLLITVAAPAVMMMP